MKNRYRYIVIALSYMFVMRIVIHFTLPIPFFSVGILLDLISAATLLIFVTVIVTHHRLQQIFYSLLLMFWTFLVFADSVYYRYFLTLVAKINAQGLTLLNPANTSEYDVEVSIYYLLLLVGVGIAIVLIFRSKQPDKLPRRAIYLALVLTILQTSLLAMIMFPRERQSIEYYQTDHYLFKTMHDRPMFAQRYGFFNYHWIDLLQFPTSIDEEVVYQEVDTFFHSKPAHELNDYSGKFENYNLIYITVESFDTRFIDETLTPTLYQMMTKGYRFNQFYVPVFQQGATCNSEFMAITGIGAANSHRYSNSICHTYKDNVFPYALPNQLKDIGYQTYYFHSGYEWFYHRETLVPNYGFETVKFLEDIERAGITDFNVRFDTDMMTFIDTFVELDGSPFYLHLLTYGLHGAYTQEDYDYGDLIDTTPGYETIDPTIKVYLQKLIEFDRLLAMISMWLQTENLYDETLFVIHTDHYPFMLNLDILGDFVGNDITDETLFQQDLILYNASMTPQTFHQVGSTIDLAPTLLNLLYPQGEFTYFTGNDLFSDDQGYVLLHDFSLIDGANRYYLREAYRGNKALKETLENELYKQMQAYELQIDLLNIDYFRLKKDRE